MVGPVQTVHSGKSETENQGFLPGGCSVSSEIQFIQRETYPPSSNLLIPLFLLMVAEADFKLRGSGNLRGSDLTDLLYHH